MKQIDARLAELKPHPKNYNKHSDAQLGRLMESLRRFGQPKEIVVWQGFIIAGHGLVEAAKRLKWATLRAADASEVWSEAEALAFMAADNELARLADPDEAALAQLVASLGDIDAELAALAAGTDERVKELLATLKDPPGEDPGPQIDRAEELREKWQTELGQIWAVGEHRLIVGDCRDPDIWTRLLEGVKVNGVFTSPPYAEQRKEQYGGVPTAEYVEWWEAVQANVKANLASDGSFFVNIKPHCEDGERMLYVFDLVLAMRRRWGWRFMDEWCWRLTTNGMPGNFSPRLKNAFEPVFWFAFGDPKLRTGEIMQKTKPASIKRYSNLSDKEASGARIHSTTGSGFNKDFTKFSLSEALPSNVLELAPAVNDNSHAAAFPVALPDFFIRAYSDTGDLWLDPFCGSGTTIVAAHNNGRRCYGIELLPKYAAVILERLQGATGGTPEVIA